jgi:hypothetical protein
MTPAGPRQSAITSVNGSLVRPGERGFEDAVHIDSHGARRLISKLHSSTPRRLCQHRVNETNRIQHTRRHRHEVTDLIQEGTLPWRG